VDQGEVLRVTVSTNTNRPLGAVGAMPMPTADSFADSDMLEDPAELLEQLRQLKCEKKRLKQKWRQCHSGGRGGGGKQDKLQARCQKHCQKHLMKEERARLKDEKGRLKEEHKQWKRAMCAHKHQLIHQLKQERRQDYPGNIALARLVKDVTFPEGSAVACGATFTKIWRVRNEGAEAWPAGTLLVPVRRMANAGGGCFGDHALLAGPAAVEVPVAKQGETVDITVQFTAPQEPGLYEGVYRLQGPGGRRFGQRLIVSVRGSAGSSSEEEEGEGGLMALDWVDLLTKLEQMGFNDKQENMTLLTRCEGDLNQVISRLLSRRAEDANEDAMVSSLVAD